MSEGMADKGANNAPNNASNNEQNNAKKNEGLKRDIKKIGVMFLVLNGLIGAGIFAMPGKLAISAGLWSPWLFLLAGALILTVVLTYAELASYFDKTGGPVAYATESFGPAVGFQMGWLLYLGRMTAMGANSNVIVIYAAFLFPELSGELSRAALLLLIIGALTFINYRGVKHGVTALMVFGVLKVIPIILLIILGLSHIEGLSILPAAAPEISELNITALLLVYAYIGFEGAIVTAGETQNPKKNLPKTLVMTVVGIMLFYFLIQMSYMAVVGDGVSSERPLVDMAQILMGTTGATILVFTAIFSITGNLSSIMIAAPRMTFAMAQDKTLPSIFGNIHPKFKTPAFSILFLGAMSAVLAVQGDFLGLAIASTLARMIAYAVSMLMLPKIRKTHKRQAGQFRLPFGYLIPALGFVLSVWCAFQSGADAWIMLGVLMVVGEVLRFCGSRAVRE